MKFDAAAGMPVEPEESNRFVSIECIFGESIDFLDGRQRAQYRGKNQL